MNAVLTLLAVALAVTACKGKETGRDTTSAPSATIDTVLPPEQALARFRGTAPRVESLTAGTPTTDSLLKTFSRAVRTNDTAALVRLAMTRAEFADLYYPNHPRGKPPYDLSPQLMWYQLTENSEQGLRRLLAARGGRDLRITSVACSDTIRLSPTTAVLASCRTTGTARTADSAQAALFSGIIISGNTRKLVGYANRL